MQLLSQLIFVKKKIKNINDNGLKTAILRVSKKWEGGRESVCYGKLLEKIRNDCVHILILSHGNSF